MSNIDPETRLQVIRDVCNREGHGELVEVTTWADKGFAVERYICERGCGTDILKLRSAMTREELDKYLQYKQFSGTVRVRGTIEVQP